MKSFATLSLVSTLVLSAWAQDSSDLTDIAPDVVGNLNVTEAITNSTNSGIDLSILPIASTAMAYANDMAANSSATNNGRRRRSNPGNAIDLHSHLVFPWYRELVPTTGGEPTPDWDAPTHLEFAASEGVSHTILASSTPQANVYFGNEALTIALARLINISTAVIAALYPGDFSWFAVVPLPYTSAAITEAEYAIDTLGAVGITTMSNHEGLYLGNPQFTPFFKYLNSRPGKTIVYIHPTSPYMKEGNTWLEANPTVYASGLVEFYFETARCLMDLTYSQTLQNFTNIQYISAHVGGAFPSILDRMIKSVPQMEATAKAIYSSRIWWDSAGPTYPNQVKGLQGYGVPDSQLVFGTDYPYAPSTSYTGALLGLVNDPLFTQAEINAIMSNNTKALFGAKAANW